MTRPLLRNIVLAALAVTCSFAGAQPAASPRNQAAPAVGKLQSQRPGTVDAYIVVVALDDDPVFGREAREAARVLARRLDAEGRTIVLAGPDGQTKTHAAGSPDTLSRALAGIAGVMDGREDVLVLYSTSHGVPVEGLVYKAAGAAPDAIGPYRLATMLNGLNVINRLLILQACYSGQFVPLLASESSIVITAAADAAPPSAARRATTGPCSAMLS
jgi:hypothetical protein